MPRAYYEFFLGFLTHQQELFFPGEKLGFTPHWVVQAEDPDAAYALGVEAWRQRMLGAQDINGMSMLNVFFKIFWRIHWKV